MSPELEAVIDGADTKLEAIFAGVMYVMVDIIFKLVEVVVDIVEE